MFDSYCYPAKAYPARALTIWSKELGEVELYEQDLDGGKFWRDVRLNEFPESVQQMFSFDFETVDSGAINGVLLDNGAVVRLPPGEAAKNPALLAVGQKLYARGLGGTTPVGTVVHYPRSSSIRYLVVDSGDAAAGA